eukprot:TRINITY_DN8946_c2_g3_i1.p1 TRINITY_DN8946_c2_g3~~TRINITY_DN8946_c2_g3_i1.p1  ORF type:complete len:138 (+),score=8.88 TRINITY_DN8946_c2_g3_i1:251-664(+)
MHVNKASIFCFKKICKKHKTKHPVTQYQPIVKENKISPNNKTPQTLKKIYKEYYSNIKNLKKQWSTYIAQQRTIFTHLSIPPKNGKIYKINFSHQSAPQVFTIVTTKSDAKIERKFLKFLQVFHKSVKKFTQILEQI